MLRSIRGRMWAMGLLLPLALTACAADEIWRAPEPSPGSASPSADAGGEESSPPSPPMAQPTPPGPSPLPPAMASMSELNSMRVEGTVMGPGGATELALTLFRGGSCEGAVRGAAAGAGRLQLRLTAEGNYVKGDRDFWRYQADREGSRVHKVVDGRWVKVPLARLGTYPQFCSLSRLLTRLSAVGEAFPETAVAMTRTVGGASVWVFKAGHETMTVARSTPPRVLRMEREGSYALSFSGFDEGAAPAKPPAKETVAFSVLQRGN